MFSVYHMLNEWWSGVGSISLIYACNIHVTTPHFPSVLYFLFADLIYLTKSLLYLSVRTWDALRFQALLRETLCIFEETRYLGKANPYERSRCASSGHRLCHLECSLTSTYNTKPKVYTVVTHPYVHVERFISKLLASIPSRAFKERLFNRCWNMAGGICLQKLAAFQTYPQGDE